MISFCQEEGNPIKGGPVDALIVYACDADRKGELKKAFDILIMSKSG